ncbi:hypothetical protein BDW22DRAFT_1329408 [Trametopsis cervina]|nr:hypothetical protein BDW22DRAFT_1329408 [Trametopsis cervina]
MSWPSPLKGYENAEPLSDRVNADSKSLYNPPAPKSAAYDKYPEPFDQSKNAFDFHVYYMQSDPEQSKFARELHERIRREFPELRIYKFWDKPVGVVLESGPHPTAMFEINTFTPHETGTLFGWLVVNRGPCSVLVHPNTGDAYKDHTALVTWIGQPWPINAEMLRRFAH